MTQLPNDGAPPARLRWRCPICRVRFALRPTTETEVTFRARCTAHEAASKVCRAKILIKDLFGQGLVPLRAYNNPRTFTETYAALKEAGLVHWYQTHVDGENYVRPTPWGPAWAAQYDTYLFRTSKTPLSERIALLVSVASSSDDIDSIRAFLALQGRQRQFDLGGAP